MFNGQLDTGLFDSLLDGVLILDENKAFVYANEAFARIADVPLRRMKTKTISEVLSCHEDFWASITLDKLQSEGSPYRELACVKHDKQEVSLQVSARLFRTNEKTLLVLYFRDVTLEKTLQLKYRKELDQKDLVIKELDKKLFEMQFLLKIASIQNEHSPDEPFLMEQVEQTLREAFSAPVIAHLSQNGNDSILALQTFAAAPEYDAQRTHSLVDNFWQHLQVNKIELSADSVQLVPGKDLDWTVIRLQGRSLDFGIILMITEPQQRATIETNSHLFDNVAKQIALSMENSSLYLKSITDEMTKLFNHRYFKFSLQRELQRNKRLNTHFSLLIIDVDFFKKVNDTYGHQTGDQVLKTVAEVIKLSCRNTDIVSRYGGEEFAAILVDTDRTGAVGVAERIRSQIENTSVETEKFGTIKVTASIGVSVFPHHGSDEFHMIEAADTALYEAKMKGRNRTVIRNWSNSDEFTIITPEELASLRKSG